MKSFRRVWIAWVILGVFGVLALLACLFPFSQAKCGAALSTGFEPQNSLGPQNNSVSFCVFCGSRIIPMGECDSTSVYDGSAVSWLPLPASPPAGMLRRCHS